MIAVGCLGFLLFLGNYWLLDLDRESLAPYVAYTVTLGLGYLCLMLAGIPAACGLSACSMIRLTGPMRASRRKLVAYITNIRSICRPVFFIKRNGTTDESTFRIRIVEQP